MVITNQMILDLIRSTKKDSESDIQTAFSNLLGKHILSFNKKTVKNKIQQFEKYVNDKYLKIQFNIRRQKGGIGKSFGTFHVINVI